MEQMKCALKSVLAWVRPQTVWTFLNALIQWKCRKDRVILREICGRSVAMKCGSATQCGLVPCLDWNRAISV